MSAFKCKIYVSFASPKGKRQKALYVQHSTTVRCVSKATLPTDRKRSQSGCVHEKTCSSETGVVMKLFDFDNFIS